MQGEPIHDRTADSRSVTADYHCIDGISAQEIPGYNIVQTAGPVLQTAVLQVLRQESDPFPAAQSAVDELSAP